MDQLNAEFSDRPLKTDYKSSGEVDDEEPTEKVPAWDGKGKAKDLEKFVFAGTGVLDGDGYFGVGAGFVGREFEKMIGILFDDCEIADVA